MAGVEQDEDLAKQDLRDQSRLEYLRRPWESSWAEIDERFPDGAGGINRGSPGQLRGQRNYDSTHVTSLDRFKAAMRAITTPEEKDYIKPSFLDQDLMKLRSVQLWCERNGPRLYAIRHAAHTGFGIAVDEDWDQLGRYGTSGVWQEASTFGLMYSCLNLSESYIDVDFAGRVNRHHRKVEKTARQCAELFGGVENLTPKMRDALQPRSNKENEKFELLHVVAPNTEWDRERMDHRRFPIASRYLAIGEKMFVRRRGYDTMPVSVSRHTTSAGEIYGRSPAFKVMPNIQGVNAMKKTTLRAAHKAVDPALLFFDDAGVTQLSSKPGGLNPGLVDEMGRPMVARMPGGENGIPFALEMIQDEQATIRTAFLEEFYKILTDPNSRMTTTEVLEVMSKQGVLVRPYASRYATEKQGPMTNRDLDLALRAGQIEPFPPEVVEAGAWPVIDYENMLAAMARAESSAKTMRWMETLVPFANVQADILDAVDADAVAQGLAAEIGVKPSYVRTPDQIAAIREGRKANEQASIDAELLAKSAGAAKDLAQAGSYSEAA